ncbi:MAG: PilW family protein, partial [Gammaproteobacteria bacterium]|nr:PilW family protein [Gammaproteobacteria bacterium]
IEVDSLRGFTLIELMIALAIGTFLIAGVFTVSINTHDSRRIVEAEVKMLDDARFALETIGYDLRMAGVLGKLNEKYLVISKSITTTGECYAGWATNTTNLVYAHNDSAAGVAGCVSDYLTGDVLEMRYTMRNPVAAPDASTIYVFGDVNTAEYFQGGSTAAGGKLNYQAVARTYYINSWSDELGDGNPSLHMVTLLPDATVADTMILSGVQNMQIQFGIDSNGDGAVDQYVDPSATMSWDNVLTAQVWLVVKSEEYVMGFDSSQSVVLPTGTITIPNDGYKRIVVNSVFRLRNSGNG